MCCPSVGGGESTFGGQIPAAATAGALHPEAGEGHSPDAVVMVRRATEVLGIEHVGQWMRSRIPSLDNQTPYALMQTAGGRERVERVLLKIEHGVY